MKYQSFTVRFARRVWRQWRYDVTPGGRYLVMALAFTGVGAISVQLPIYQIFCGLLSLLLIAGLTGLLIRPTVSIRGALPQKVTAGMTVSGHYRVTNKSRWPALDLALGFFNLPRGIRQVEHDGGDCGDLSGGATRECTVSLRPARRGLYELPPVRAYSTFPFNIGRFGNSFAASGSLLVLPDFHQIDKLSLPVGNRYQPGGIALTSHVGESPEYIGNREYTPGTPVRRLDFRSWARLGKPIVREYHEEYYCRIAIVLDTFVNAKRKMPPDGFADLEAAVSLTAAAADALSHGEYIIDLFAAGPELYTFRSGRHTAHFENLLEILACVEACRTNPFEVVTPAISDELSQITSAVCIFLDWDRARRDLARVIVEAGCSLKVLIVRDGPTTEPLSDVDAEIAVLTTDQVRNGGLDSL